MRAEQTEKKGKNEKKEKKENERKEGKRRKKERGKKKKGSDVCAAVSSFFESGSMLREINCSIIALVPKVPNPGSMHDYRPISCCNTIYKCISKIIAARIKQCIPDIISLSQSAFVHSQPIIFFIHPRNRGLLQILSSGRQWSRVSVSPQMQGYQPNSLMLCR